MRRDLSLLLLFALVTIARSQSGLQFGVLDYLDIEDPLANWWNNRDNIIQDSYAPCRIRGGASNVDREGTCMHSTECRFTRGRVAGRGTCSFLHTCCIYDRLVANTTIKARVAYFRNAQSSRLTGRNNQLRLELLNENICQVRIDILNMDIAPPTSSPTSAGITATYLRCITDRFTVEPSHPDVKVPEICGKNTNQHFYVHLSREQHLTRYVTLAMSLSENLPGNQIGGGVNNPTTISTTWDIKATQLECPRKLSHFLGQHVEKNRNQLVRDYEELAPEGCLQYFRERTGVVKSFGFISTTDSTLITNQDYAVCFKRTRGSCGVRFTNNYFSLRTSTSKVLCLDEYIYVPELRSEFLDNDWVSDHRICRMTTSSHQLTSEHPGPLYIHVHSTEPLNLASSDDILPFGFSWNYDTNIECTPDPTM